MKERDIIIIIFMHSFHLLFATRSLIHCFTLVAAHTINIHNYDSKKQLHCPYIHFFSLKRFIYMLVCKHQSSQLVHTPTPLNSGGMSLFLFVVVWFSSTQVGLFPHLGGSRAGPRVPGGLPHSGPPRPLPVPVAWGGGLR